MTLRASIALTVALLATLVWSLFSGLNGRGPALDQATADLHDFILDESDLRRDLLSARAGLLRNYDPVNQTVSSLEADRSRLAAAGLADDLGKQLVPLLARQADLVEKFKSDNAVLQNGLTYFSLFSSRLRAPATAGSLAQAANDLSAAMLQLTLDTSPETAQAVEHQLARLSGQSAPAESADAVVSLLEYGQLLSRVLPETDTVLRDILAMPFDAEEMKVAELIGTVRQAERTRADQFRILLYTTSLLLLAQVVHFALQLQRRRLAAKRRAAFERAVASLSVRLINCNPDDLPGLVHQALARLAEVARADRAYFMINSAPTQTFAWARPGVTYSAHWPENAAEIARRLPATEHGVTHVADRQLLPNGPVRTRLTEAGIHCWTCIAASDQQKLSYLLGLDWLATKCEWVPELRLLRMAFDAIASAVRREILTRDRARLEQSVQRAKQVETIAALTGGVAHNFNNIVGTILGYAEMIDEKVLPGLGLARQVAGIQQAGERARTLIEQILSYGKKRDARRDLVDMRSLLAETVGQLALSLPQSVGIVTDAMPDGAALVSGETAQLQQVIINLCNNAAQAMENRGEVTVALDVQDLAQDCRLSHGRLAASHYVRLIVTDHGRGMKPETLDQIFEPFFTTRIEGNGLGLATVRSIVQEHGGALHVESAAGTGSRFEVWLPRTCSTPGFVATNSTSQQFGSGETVLLLSDDQGKLLHDEEVVAALGYEPVGFVEVERMYAALREAPDRFDVAMISIPGPSMQADVVRCLARVKPSMPVIVVSTKPNELEGDDLRALQGSAVVPQSSGSFELAAAFRRALARSEQRVSTLSL